MKKLETAVIILTGLAVVFGVVVMAAGATWFGLMVTVAALVALTYAFWPKRGDDREEGTMVGCISYETRGDSVVLSVDLEDLAADAGLPDDVVTGVKTCVNDEDKSKDYYFCEMYARGDDRYFLKRLVIIRVDAFGNLKNLNVMLNGESYEAILGGSVAKDLEVYLDGEFMMRLALSDFSTLVRAFGENVALPWLKVEGGLDIAAEN